MEKEATSPDNKQSQPNQSDKSVLQPQTDSYSANPNQIVYDMVYQNDFIINVADVYFARKVLVLNKKDEYVYVKLNHANLGDKVYLVAKCYGTPRKGKLVLSLREIENTDTTQNLYSNNPVPFLVNGVEKTEMEYTLDGSITYAKEIELRPKDDKKYQELQEKLKNTKTKNTFLFVRAKIKETTAIRVTFKSFFAGQFSAVDNLNYYDFLTQEKERFEIKAILGIITYHIYWNTETEGKIEKHIPKTIADEYKNKYKYVYHDKEGNEHNICMVERHKTKEKQRGMAKSQKPIHSKIVNDNSVSEGQTSRRVIYENGDIAEYGYHDTLGKTWMHYKSTGKEIELIRMPDSLNHSKDNITIKYSFENTERRYTNPDLFAGFIGLLADISIKLVSEGSSFKEASCFPSQTHVNGASIDLDYLYNLKNDQQVIDSAIKFHFDVRLKGVNSYCSKLLRAKPSGSLHNSHLHIGGFISSKIIKK